MARSRSISYPTSYKRYTTTPPATRGSGAGVGVAWRTSGPCSSRICRPPPRIGDLLRSLRGRDVAQHGGSVRRVTPLDQEADRPRGQVGELRFQSREVHIVQVT